MLESANSNLPNELDTLACTIEETRATHPVLSEAINKWLDNFRRISRRSAGAARIVALRIASFALICLATAGCDGNYLVWSSDGKLGAVIGAKGLRVCDAEGSISKVLADKAGLFRWIPGAEHQGMYVGYDYAGRWTDVKPLLSIDQDRMIQDESLKLKRKIYTYRGDPKKFPENALRTFNYPLEAAMHLHATATPDIEKLALKRWPPYAFIKVPIFYIKLVNVDTNAVTQIRTIDRGIDEIVELKASPNGKFIACVKHEKGQERNYIEVIPNVAFAKPVIIAYNTNAFPDWSADSRHLFYTRANTENEPDLLRGQPVHEGALYKVEVADASGKVLSVPKQQRMARVVFDNRAPVRALKDGRVLFISRELRIPSAINSNLSSALFYLDGNKSDVLIRRTDDIAFFEPNPEQDQLAVTTSGGALLVCKSNGNEIFEICNAKELRLSGLLPQWKSNQELSFGTEQVAQKGSKSNYSIYLWTKASGMKDLSKSWGKEAASEIIVHRDIFQEAMTGVLEDIDRKMEK